VDTEFLFQDSPVLLEVSADLILSGMTKC